MAKQNQQQKEKQDRQVRFQEIQKMKIEKASQPGSFVLDKPMTQEMEALLFMVNQLNQKHPRFVVSIGSGFGQGSNAKADKINEELRDILFRIGRLGKQMAKEIHHNERFNIPHVMSKAFTEYNKQFQPKPAEKPAAKPKKKATGTATATKAAKKTVTKTANPPELKAVETAPADDNKTTEKVGEDAPAKTAATS